jgi:hypothetical protein
MLQAPLPRKLHQFPVVRSYMTPTHPETRAVDVMAADCVAAPPNAPLAEVTSDDALVALSELLSEPA